MTVHDVTTAPIALDNGVRRQHLRTLALALLGVLMLLTPAAAAAVSAYLFRGPVQDLSAVADPFGDARAQVHLATGDDSSRVALIVQGIDRSAAGNTYGAHLNVGPCVEGNGAAALGHYNVPPGVINPQNEVWLDFTVNPGGVGRSATTVPFVPAPGTRSVVIHEAPTNPVTGAAGARLACLSVVW